MPLNTDTNFSDVFADDVTDLRPSKAAAQIVPYDVSAGYFHAAGTTLLAGRSFTLHDDKNAPRVAIAEDGKYIMLAENPQPVMFRPILQSPATASWLVVRSNRDPQQLTAALNKCMRALDPGLPFPIRTWYKELDNTLFPARVATVSLGVLGGLGAMLALTEMFEMAAYSVSKRLRDSAFASPWAHSEKRVLRSAPGRVLRLLGFGSVASLLLGMAAGKGLSFLVYQANPRDPMVLVGVLLTMLLMGLIAAWVPAQRALATDPSILLLNE